jgi:hypothetical protein
MGPCFRSDDRFSKTHSLSHTSAISPRHPREFCVTISRLSNEEGAGNAGRSGSARGLACE